MSGANNYFPGKVVAEISGLPTASVQAWSDKLRYVDMNVASGGIARGSAVTTTFVDVFSYTGSGYFAGFILNVETFTLWQTRLIIDGNEILIGSNGISSDDMSSDTVYDVDDLTDINQASLGISKGSHDRIVFTSPLDIPIRYDSSVVIKLARTSGPSKKFQAGLVILSKET